MYPSKTLVAALAVALSLAALSARTVHAHGEFDEDTLAEFEQHLDDYQHDVATLVAEIDPIVAGYAAGEEVTGKIAELIEHWEEVGVHAAIETRATVTYPTVWQAVIGLQQTVTAGKPEADVAAAGDRFKAALWQGLGAVRLAASQVASQPVAAADEPPASGPETVDRIIADLDVAVSAYQAGNLQQAERLIHETYMTRFEGLEGELIEHDPELVSSLEKDFNANLPLLLQQGAAMERIRAQLQAMTEQLETASQILQRAEQTRSEVF